MMNLPPIYRWIAVNLLFVIFHPSWTPLLPSVVQSLAVSLVLFVAPAAGWSALFGPPPRALGMRLTRNVAVSTALLIAMLGGFKLSGVAPSQLLAWNSMWLVTNLGFLTAALTGQLAARRRSLTMRETALGAGLFIAGYALFFLGATRVVPPQADHDLEVQATGYGLLTRFEPFLLTDRHTTYYFAHPPLLHLYVGASFLYHGSFSELEPYDAASRRAHAAKQHLPVVPPDGLVRAHRRETALYRTNGADGEYYQLLPSDGGPMRRALAEDVELALIRKRYDEHPFPVETRTPNLFLASATVALLGIWAARISGGLWIGLLAAAAYATSPEVFVRSSYGGYFAIGTFTSLLMLLSVEFWRRQPSWRAAGIPAVSGVLTGLADHKMIVLPIALALKQGLAWIREPRRNVMALVSPVIVGFALGTIFYWCYGLAIAPGAFIEDHLRTHVLDRLTYENPLGYGGYPSVVELWAEFARNTGFALLPIALVLLVHDTWRGNNRSRRAPSRDVWLLWVLVTAVAFSIIDWRMTKHLATLMLPLTLSLVPNRGAATWRTAVPVVTMVLVLAFNLKTIGLLIDNFAGFRVTPVW